MTTTRFAQACSVEQADELCLHAQPLAGGTDLLVGEDVGLPAAVVDLTPLGRDGAVVAAVGSRVRISALAPLNVVYGSLPAGSIAIRDAIDLFGSPQIRNRATIGGNLANGSPAADLSPPLLALDATVGIRRGGRQRTMALADFLMGPGRTALADGEWIHTIECDADLASGFRKVAGRRALAIAVVSLAWAWRRHDDGRLHDVRLAAGAVAPTAVRCHRVEAILEGGCPTVDMIEEGQHALSDDIAPITDVRGSAEYRRWAMQGLIAELLTPLTRLPSTTHQPGV